MSHTIFFIASTTATYFVLHVLMKWMELIHEGEMMLENVIPKIDPI
jgi:hypothetical protein